MQAENVQIWVNSEHAPYVETKPLHHSQIVLKRLEDGIVIQIQVQRLGFDIRSMFG
eukprot:gene69080-94667_t